MKTTLDRINTKLFANLFCLAIPLILSANCAADFITFSYSGIVEEDASGGSDLDPDPFKAFGGELMTVTYTFDSESWDNNMSANGDYLDAITDMTVTVGANVYSNIGTGDIIITNNDVNPDQYRVFSFVTGPAVGDLSSIQLRMIFSDSTHTVYSTDALPVTQPNPDDFNLDAQINLQFTGPGFDDFGNIITNTVTLFTPGLLGDFDMDEDVDGADFLAWQRGFGATYNAGDLNDWQANYGATPGALATSTSVPEPSTLALCFVLGLVGVVRRRR